MAAALLALLILLAGCEPVDRAHLAKEVLKADPEFSVTLKERDNYASRIETADRELDLKRQTVKRAMGKLRQDLAESIQTVKQKRAHYRSLIEPELKRLRLAQSLAQDELKAKRQQHAGVGRSIAKLRKALKDSAEAWSPQEAQRQVLHQQEMLDDAKRLDREIAALNDHLKLLKHKLFLLRL